MQARRQFVAISIVPAIPKKEQSSYPGTCKGLHLQLHTQTRQSQEDTPVAGGAV